MHLFLLRGERRPFAQDEMHWALRHMYYCCHALRSPERRLRNPLTDRDFQILNLDVQFLILHLL